jgi:hypothetical protein
MLGKAYHYGALNPNELYAVWRAKAERVKPKGGLNSRCT